MECKRTGSRLSHLGANSPVRGRSAVMKKFVRPVCMIVSSPRRQGDGEACLSLVGGFPTAGSVGRGREILCPDWAESAISVVQPDLKPFMRKGLLDN